eukprot:710840-Alexandrium_andersonii.AAC.1
MSRDATALGLLADPSQSGLGTAPPRPGPLARPASLEEHTRKAHARQHSTATTARTHTHATHTHATHRPEPTHHHPSRGRVHKGT